MTGEITSARPGSCRSAGLKEKAAGRSARAGSKPCYIPKDNVKDLAEIPDNVKRGLEHRPCPAHGSTCAEASLGRKMPKPIEWEESRGESIRSASWPEDDDRGGRASPLDSVEPESQM